MFVMGWFFFLTIPSGLVALVVFTVAVVLSARGRRKLDTGVPDNRGD
jgi:hypothetical protein